MTLVLAHAGHWLEGVAFGAPVVIVPAALALFVLRERRRERREQRTVQRRGVLRRSRARPGEEPHVSAALPPAVPRL